MSEVAAADELRQLADVVEAVEAGPAELLDADLRHSEGEAVAEIMAQLQDDPDIGVLVLGAASDKKGPGPLVTQLSRNAGGLPIPITIVPGDLSKERLEAIT